MKVKVNTRDLELLLNKFNQMEKNVDVVAEKSLNEITAVALAKAKKNTVKGESLDTNLRDHFFATEMKKNGNTYTREVKNDARNEYGEYYAGYYEHGHRTRLGTSKNPNYKPRAGAKAWVKGRYPLLKATVNARSKAPRIISNNMKKVFGD